MLGDYKKEIWIFKHYLKNFKIIQQYQRKTRFYTRAEQTVSRLKWDPVFEISASFVFHQIILLCIESTKH